MKYTLMSVLSIVLLATSLTAQNGPIPKNMEAIQRGVEQPVPPIQLNPQNHPLRPMQSLLNSFGFRATNKQTSFGNNRASAVPIEDRISALEAKVEALQSELEVQKALIKQLQELLNQQQKKN